MPTVNGSSEAFPESSGSRPDGGTARRSMADITRLFMNGAAVRPGSIPQRMSPQSRANQPITPNSGGGVMAAAVAARETVRPSLPISAAVARPTFSENPQKIHPVVQLAITDALGNRGPEALLEAAKLLAAGRQCTVGVISYSGETLTIHRVDAARLPRFVGSAFAHPESPLDVQLARTLFGLRENIDAWIIGVPSLEDTMAERLCDAASDWLLFCGVDNDSLVACYRGLKQARGMVGTIDDRRIRLFVRTLEPSQARRVHDRLKHVAQGFLDQPVELLSLDPRGGATVEKIAQFTSTDVAVTQSVWMSVVDFIHDISLPEEVDEELLPENTIAELADDEEPLLENVLDPEERAALAFECVEEEKPAPQALDVEKTVVATAPVALPKPMEETKPLQQQKTAPTVLPTESLMAVDLPKDPGNRTELWQGIEEALACVREGQTPLAARPPQEPAATLTVDGQGRLHLWVLVNAADLSSWSALHQWAQQHRELLALTRGDGTVNATLAVQAHVVLPPGMARRVLPAAGDAVRWYRAEKISWKGQWGLVIVPQA